MPLEIQRIGISQAFQGLGVSNSFEFALQEARDLGLHWAWLRLERNFSTDYDKYGFGKWQHSFPVGDGKVDCDWLQIKL